MSDQKLVESEQALLKGYFNKLLEDYYPCLDQMNKKKMTFSFEILRDAKGPSKVKMKVRIARHAIEGEFVGYSEDPNQEGLDFEGDDEEN
jgi:hypothetical protein